MKKFILSLFLILGLILPAAAFAKYESSSEDVQSVVAYGKYGDTLVPLQVGSDGSLVVEVGITDDIDSVYITDITKKFGIGTTDPEYLLDVNGQVRILGQDGITNQWGDSLDFFGCGDNNLCWKPNATTGVFGIQYSGGVQISMEYDGTNMVFDSTSGGVSTSDFFRSAMQTVTVASNGTGTAATGTVTPTTNNIRLQCNDTDGCTMSMGETGAQTGMEVTIVNNTANVATFADSAGVLETVGGASCALGSNDSISVFYQNSTWLSQHCVDR